MGKYSEDDLFELAFQVVLGEKNESELSELEADELEKVHTIAKWGRSALGWQDKTAPPHAVRRKVIQELKSKSSHLRHSFRNQQSNQDVSKLAQRVVFPVFPLSYIAKQETIIRRKFVEGICREFQGKELSLLFTLLEGDLKENLLACMSYILAQEIREDLKEDLPFSETQYNLILARFSVSSIRILLKMEEADSKIKDYAQQFSDELKEKLFSYLKTLPVKFGVISELEALTEAKLRKLLGLTPRNDLALLQFILPRKLIENLLRFLPNRQKEDVLERIAYLKRNMEEGVGTYIDILDAIKTWPATIEKVLNED